MDRYVKALTKAEKQKRIRKVKKAKKVKPVEVIQLTKGKPKQLIERQIIPLLKTQQIPKNSVADVDKLIAEGKKKGLSNEAILQDIKAREKLKEMILKKRQYVDLPKLENPFSSKPKTTKTQLDEILVRLNSFDDNSKLSKARQELFEYLKLLKPAHALEILKDVDLNDAEILNEHISELNPQFKKEHLKEFSYVVNPTIISKKIALAKKSHLKTFENQFTMMTSELFSKFINDFQNAFPSPDADKEFHNFLVFLRNHFNVEGHPDRYPTFYYPPTEEEVHIDDVAKQYKDSKTQPLQPEASPGLGASADNETFQTPIKQFTPIKPLTPLQAVREQKRLHQEEQQRLKEEKQRQAEEQARIQAEEQARLQPEEEQLRKDELLPETPQSTSTREANKFIAEYWNIIKTNKFQNAGIHIGQVKRFVKEEQFTVSLTGRVLRFTDKNRQKYNVDEMVEYMQHYQPQAEEDVEQAQAEGFKRRVHRAIGIQKGLEHIKQHKGKKIHDKVKRKLVSLIKGGKLVL